MHIYIYIYVYLYICIHINICIYISVTGHRDGKGIMIETKRFRALIVFGVPAWMPVGVQTNTGSSDVHAQWFSHWKIRADDHDVIM